MSTVWPLLTVVDLMVCASAVLEKIVASAENTTSQVIIFDKRIDFRGNFVAARIFYTGLKGVTSENACRHICARIMRVLPCAGRRNKIF